MGEISVLLRWVTTRTRTQTSSETMLTKALLSAALICAPSLAIAEEWSSRHGPCGQWWGRWVVEQEQSGVWVGSIDFVHGGGACEPASGDRISMPVRAVVVGKDFFAFRTTGSYACHAHGQMRSEGMSGFETCTGATSASPMFLRFEPPERR